MKNIICLIALMCAHSLYAQRVEIAVGSGWAEIPVQQTQSELKPGWKIVDYQTKSRLVHYLIGGRASQLAEGNRPFFRVTPGEREVLFDYALIRLKRYNGYRKLPKVKLLENDYIRLEPNVFDVKAEGDSFVCQPREPLAAGEYILVCLSQKAIGDLGDLLVFPFCVLKE